RTYLYRYRHNSLEPVMLEQAKAAAEQAVRLDEYLADARLSRGLVYLRLGERAAAAAELEEALALDPALADAHRGLGELHESKRDFAAAETAFRAAITLDPNHRLFHDRLGALMFKTGRYEAAEAAFKDSIASAPDSIYGHRGLASTYYLQGRLDEAAVELQKALRIKPSATLYSSLGTIFFSQGLYEKAADAYTKALSSSANNSIYWSNLADAYRQIPDREAETREALLRAEQLLTERIALQPEDATLWSRRALVLAKLGERERALSELARVDRAGTVDTYTRYRVAVGYELCGERGSALEQLETALEAGFSLPEIRRDPELIELRADPRFHRLVVKLDSASPRTDRPASQDRQ
ncbi:MAG: tetratricopeptide repeat protein, partial [Acidobacteriota bacterium]